MSTADEHVANEGAMGPIAESGAPHRVGGFLYHRDGDRWEWSDTVARMHGYEPGTVTPTTTLLLSHKHPDDRAHVAQTLHAIRTSGGAFSSRHRIIDTKAVTRSVVVVGDRLLDDTGESIGSTGFYIDITDTLDRTVTETVDEVVADITASRGAIEQAKGMLMAIYSIPADRAFDILVWHSQQTNVKLREVAEGLLTRVATEFTVPTTVRTRFDHLLLHT
ncbi:PAS and ANTAR domain-containing protein [Rhodococcus qingshengii]|uniref:PAS and ANTAR domain-containing protein n=1 Tax=Rhodococcus qingshengii TaxID=334542 RepID=UPI002034ECB0|nr:PAS and ANTAR domain-containing protein [Rhodococcus qingshengii]